MSKITLNATVQEQLEMPNTVCVPFIVTRNDVPYIVILSPNSVLFFDTSDGSLTYSQTTGYLKDNFKFVRFLTKGESFTFTQ